MYGEARNMKWVIPSAAFALLLFLTRMLAEANKEEWRWLAVSFGVMCAVAGIAAIGNYYDYRMTIRASWFEREQRARAITPFAAEMESARGVHPDAAAMLINERHRVWMLKSGQPTQGILPHSVLFDAPQVTDFFLKYFLENSSKTTVLPKRLLVDGRKTRFDPLGLVAEYDMYDKLIELLEKKGMIRKYNQFSIHEFVSPWEPRLVAEDFGLEWDEPAKANDENNQKENQ